jgi:hydrogenase maturation protein HypF
MRLRIVIRGAVQGVGFRPFVFRLATELGLRGWVNNSAQGVFIEAEGERDPLETFLLRLPRECPPRSFIQSLEPSWLDDAGYTAFEIRASASDGEKSALVLPDIATCTDCLREVLDPGDRRHRYPFTNCTHCGPRFSLIEALPYDRANTAMKVFTMCAACRAEYEDPANRRFHAQPNACPDCGPQLAWWIAGALAARRHEALLAAVAMMRDGGIVAVKGLGGFHLMCLAEDDAAVRRLRERKHREEKPLALMFPTRECVLEVCDVAPLEERLLTSAEAPIVLLRRRAAESRATTSPLLDPHPPELGSSGRETAPSSACPISSRVAPGNPWLGVMLPYTPLHHLMLREIGAPVVATSGNLSDEPICIDETEARERLAGIADGFLVHDRPIVRHVDDSIVRVVAGREMVLRRARGYAPLPVTVQSAICNPQSAIVLGVGAHLKNTVALGVGSQVFLSQHIGDLETELAHNAFQRVAADLQTLFDAPVTRVAADLHPDYLSTRFARHSRVPMVQVQHHLAHVLACMAENELEPPVLGVAWDGTGFGPDGTVWGGEFILVERAADGRMTWRRVAHLRPFRLPGGEVAVREPRRSALGLLFELQSGDQERRHSCRLSAPLSEVADTQVCTPDTDDAPSGWLDLALTPTLRAFSVPELRALTTMLERDLNSPRTSSMGRLFDAVASLTGLRQLSHFEGQAAMELEFAADGLLDSAGYPLPLTGEGDTAPWQVDWRPLVESLLADVERGVAVSAMAAKFHNALSESVVAMARSAAVEQVVLSGGCFQNQRLLEETITRLSRAGFRPYWHQRVPPNDGGIALGQVVAARWNLVKS